MSDAKTELVDHKDCGPMPAYDYKNKPVCLGCESETFVVAVGKDSQWNWKCTSCQSELMER
jgi:hypothetical protein